MMTKSHPLNSFKYAFEGVRYALTTQRNLQIHVSVAVIVAIIGVWVRLKLVEWAIIALSIGLVIALELVNTALETVIDLTSPNIHPLAKVCKDVGAAAVLVGAGTAVVVGFLILGPPLLRVFVFAIRP